MALKAFKGALDKRVTELHGELRGGRYRVTSVRRTYIPKASGPVPPLDALTWQA